ncbi:ribosomal protein S6e [Actinidia rufa]|uniref:Ribosomal protein S6e n=1 Tax=Actinidia rufa TaxID=165716 RepID=A0A7J0FCZ0_9ERIC|nr:ribosomal protein S6e [Actinidia rufa]
MGGCDTKGFPMKQGVLTPGLVRLLLHIGTPCFCGYRRRNERRKSVRGCVVSRDLSVLNLVIVKKGKKVSKAPKIQRLVTPWTLQRKRARIVKKKRIAKAKSEAAEYQTLLASRLKEQRERRSESSLARSSVLEARGAHTAPRHG